jgi:hypothetical protein
VSDQVMPPPSGPDTAGPRPGQPGPEPWRLLFSQGSPRLGWVFRDRKELVPAYPEPRPGADSVRSSVLARAAAAEKKLRRAWKWVARPSIGLALILVLGSACSASVGDSAFSPVLAVITIAVLCGPGLAYTGWCWLERDKARDVPPEQAYQKALTDWQQRSAQHAQSALGQLTDVQEWGSVTVPPRRTDIFGGTLAGWQSLIAVHGASVLSSRPLLIVDLTGQHPAQGLLALAEHVGIQTTAWRLPADLGRSGILNQLPPDAFAAAVAEALHAGAQGGARTERAADTMILRRLTEAITAGGLTMPRLAAAIRAARGGETGALLSEPELELIRGTLFPAVGGAREQAAPSLTRLESVIPDLAARSGQGWPEATGSCICISLDTAPRSAENEILGALVIQWLTVQAAKATAEFPSLIVAGAGDITSAHLERLSDACELRKVPLTLLFRHLREDAVQMLGGATTTAFMRTGNHAEAEQAASYLGRSHSYQVSGYTATKGGSVTQTVGGGTGTGTSTSDSVSRGSNKGWSHGSSFADAGNTSSGSNSGGDNKSRTTGTSTSTSTNQNWSTADGTTWSDAENTQRVYEYRVEPTVLQDLPEQMLLLADRSPGSLTLRAVECDPAIITLPGASTNPLPPPPALNAATRPAVTTGPIPAGQMLGPAGGANNVNNPGSLGNPGNASAPGNDGWPPAGAEAPAPAWPRSGGPDGNPSWPQSGNPS